jgi:hypothetical protein
MSLYKYLTIDILKRVIAGSIRFSQPGAFNDPFEMLPELYTPDSSCDKNLNITFSVTAPRREPRIGELDANFTSEQCNDINSRKILANLNNSIGILSLSKNPASLLMWSHYADEYSGAIIEFNDDHDFFKGKIEMEYCDHRPKKDTSSYLLANQVVPIAELCVKSREWAYESEVRLIRNLSDCKQVSQGNRFPVFVMDIPRECIRSITLGERTSIKNQREIWDLVKNTNISLSLAAIANWGYEFRNEIIKYDKPVSEMSPTISPRTAHIFSDLNGDFGEIARWLISNHKLSKVVNNTV